MENNKKQLIERIKSANNVLVTVSANPSVDQLSAAIGLTLMLNKLGKHGTAVFSGQVPSTIEFLQPEKTLEKNTDSLRDFIIALDKSKADKLRYKVEDNHVKIFITPYRTSISQADLDFSQGDFNVELVVALGVNDQQDLDQAIVSHGRILHDATTISVTTGAASNLGSINWADEHASSLCEMVASLADPLQANLLDSQMATALMTGIVAQTDRFSNEKTAPSTMSISAALMAAGANQQLVASKLEEPAPEPPAETLPPENDNTNTPPPDDGSFTISHNPDEFFDDEREDENPVDKIHIDEEGTVKRLEDLPEPAPEPQSEPETGQEPQDEYMAGLPPLPKEEPLPEIKAVKGGGSFLPESTDNTELSVGNVPAGYNDPSDTINAPQTDIPILSHDIEDSEDNQPEAEAPAAEPAEAAEPAVLPETPALPAFEPPAPLPSQPEPEPAGEGPIVEELDPEDKSQTLSELEAAVQASYDSHASAPADQPMAPAEPAVAAVSGLDNARDAVSDALASMGTQPTEPAPLPLETLNNNFAQPLPPELAHDENQPAFTMPENLVPPTGMPADTTAAPVTDPTAPPTVPPPFMPDMNGFDSNQMPEPPVQDQPNPPAGPLPPANPSNPFNLPPA